MSTNYQRKGETQLDRIERKIKQSSLLAWQIFGVGLGVASVGFFDESEKIWLGWVLLGSGLLLWIVPMFRKS